MRTLKKLYIIVAMLFILGQSRVCLGEGNYSLGLGYYSLNYTNSAGSATISNLGHIKFVYSIDVTEKVVFWPGYSLYLLGGDNSDIGYGIDIEVAYYPLSGSGRFNSKSNFGTWTSYETIRPFVSISFNQREYQSVQSKYAGFGAYTGFHYQNSESLYYFAKVGFIALSGPLESEVNEVQVSGGVGAFIGD